MDQEKPAKGDGATNDIPNANEDEKPALRTKVYGVDCMFNCGTCGECGRSKSTQVED